MRQERYDIVVAGLGTAGAIAAIEGARRGMRVLGVDRMNGMGGLGTLGCVWDYYFGVRGGIAEEVNTLCYRERGYVPSDRGSLDKANDESHNGSLKCHILEKLFLEAGGELAYETVVTGVIREGKRVTGLTLLSNGEERTVTCAFVIDGTGDASVAKMAGCSILSGRKTDGIYATYSKTLNLVTDPEHTLGTWSISGNMRDSDGAKEITRAYLEASAQPFYLGGKFRHRLLEESPIMGFREGARIDSEANISLIDALDGKAHEDTAFFAFSHVDNVCRDVAYESVEQQDWHVVCGMWKGAALIAVPFRTLIPKGYDGILAVGKCMGVEHDLAGCLRMKRDMEKSGEAAAALAAHCVERGVGAREADAKVLQLHLRRSGCYNSLYVPGLYDVTNHWLWTRVERPTTPEELVKGITSKQPGVAMWDAKKLPFAREVLRKRLPDRACALALGMLGDEAALPALREIARERRADGDYPDACKAILLLGRMGDRASIPLLREIASRPAWLDEMEMHTDWFLQTREKIAEQFVTQAQCALERIGG